MSLSQSRVSRLAPPVSERDHFQGPAEAPVTLVEFGDYQCPYCGQAHPIVKAVQAKFGNRLRFVFRNFPLAEIHPHAAAAAQAAEAAGAQGKFWPMHDRLFEHQNALGNADLVAHAAEVGLDVARFARELSEGVHEVRVREDFMSGVRSGVNGTPTFFINGVRYEGSWDPGSLIEALSAAALAAV